MFFQKGDVCFLRSLIRSARIASMIAVQHVISFAIETLCMRDVMISFNITPATSALE